MALFDGASTYDEVYNRVVGWLQDNGADTRHLASVPGTLGRNSYITLGQLTDIELLHFDAVATSMREAAKGGEFLAVRDLCLDIQGEKRRRAKKVAAHEPFERYEGGWEILVDPENTDEATRYALAKDGEVWGDWMSHQDAVEGILEEQYSDVKVCPNCGSAAELSFSEDPRTERGYWQCDNCAIGGEDDEYSDGPIAPAEFYDEAKKYKERHKDAPFMGELGAPTDEQGRELPVRIDGGTVGSRRPFGKQAFDDLLDDEDYCPDCMEWRQVTIQDGRVTCQECGKSWTFMDAANDRERALDGRRPKQLANRTAGEWDATHKCLHCKRPIKDVEGYGWIIFPADQAPSDDPAHCVHPHGHQPAKTAGSLKFECASCGDKFRVRGHAGPETECPKCGSTDTFYTEVGNPKARYDETGKMKVDYTFSAGGIDRAAAAVRDLYCDNPAHERFEWDAVINDISADSNDFDCPVCKSDEFVHLDFAAPFAASKTAAVSGEQYRLKDDWTEVTNWGDVFTVPAGTTFTFLDTVDHLDWFKALVTFDAPMTSRKGAEPWPAGKPVRVGWGITDEKFSEKLG